MRILQSVSLFSPGRGGGVTATVYDLSKALMQRGNEVTIFTSDFELDQEYIDSLDGVTVHTFHSYFKLGNRPLLIPGAMKNARDKLKDFDVIHTHEARSFLNLILFYYAQKYGIPYIIDAHGAAARKSNSKAQWLVDNLYGRYLLKNATRVIAETELAIDEYKKIGVNEDKITTIYPPFPVDNFPKLPPKGFFRKRFNIKEQHIIVFMGRINRIKGLDFLVQSFYELSQQRGDVILAIIGSDDGYKAKLEEMIRRLNLSGKVLFTGFLSGDDKRAALVDTTVMIQPSIYEQGFPKPCIEAILSNTPAVITKGTGAAVIAERIGAGYLTEYGDVKELVDTIQYILNNPAEVAEKVHRDKQSVMANLSMENGIEDYEKLYATCIQEMRENKTVRFEK